MRRLSDKLKGEWKRQSLLGQAGHFMEPVFRPLGWDWKIGVAAMASFPAREVIVGTFGILYDVGDVDPGAIGDDGADDEAQRESRRVDLKPSRRIGNTTRCAASTAFRWRFHYGVLRAVAASVARHLQ